MAAELFLEGVGDSGRIWKIVESDPYGQFAFIYAIVGEDKIVVVDTGCGTQDIKAFLDRRVNPGATGGARLPYLVVNTHVHFDHIGGNHFFDGKDDVIAICMSDANKPFTNNYELTSLAMGVGARVKPFTVTRWLADGELLWLDDAAASKDAAMRVIHTPGHTSDSLALHCYGLNRCFTGDTVYPFTPIYLGALGASLKAYVETLDKLMAFLQNVEKEVFVDGDVRLPLADEVVPHDGDHAAAAAVVDAVVADAKEAEGDADAAAAADGEAAVDGAAEAAVDGAAEEADEEAAEAEAADPLAALVPDLLSKLTPLTGESEDALRGRFDPHRLLELAAGDVDTAIAMLLGMDDDALRAAAPPKPAGAGDGAAGDGSAAGGVDEEESKRAAMETELLVMLTAMTDQDADSLRRRFDPMRLLELSDWKVYTAVETYVNMGADIASWAPPKASPAAGGGGAAAFGAVAAEPMPDLVAFDLPASVKLSCGHVETDLAVTALLDIRTMLHDMKRGALQPVRRLEEDSVEYSNGTFSVICTYPPKFDK